MFNISPFASGEISAAFSLSLQLPSSISSIDETYFQCPSFVIPIKYTLNLSFAIAFAIVTTETHDTSCSDDLPPKTIARFFLAILFPRFIIKFGDSPCVFTL